MSFYIKTNLYLLANKIIYYKVRLFNKVTIIITMKVEKIKNVGSIDRIEAINIESSNTKAILAISFIVTIKNEKISNLKQISSSTTSYIYKNNII